MIGRVTLKSIFMAIMVLAFAGTAAAHTPPPSIAADLDLRHVSAVPARVQSFSVFTRSNAFAELTRIEPPPPSIADELAHRFAVSAKLTSGPRHFTLQSKSSERSHLGEKTWWGKENKAAPLVEPATGLALFRNRWYDPRSGSWLTPDAESYGAGSSNLYAGFNGDPVNNIDPDGNEPISASIAIAYLGNVAVQTGSDVGIDWAFHEASDLWNGTETEFDWHDSLQTNFSINLVTGGFGGKIAKFKHLQGLSTFGRKAVGEGAEYAADVAATGTIDMLLHEQSVAAAYGSAAVGGAVGRSAPMLLRGLGRGYRRLTDAYNNSIFSSEVGAIGHGVRNVAKSRATALRTLPPLTGTYADAFEGPVRERTFRAGERIFRSPQFGEIDTQPGLWFGTRRTRTRVGTESQSNIVKWGNPVDRLWEYELTADVTVYYGRVAGGKGYQLLFPSHINPADVLKYRGEDVLR